MPAGSPDNAFNFRAYVTSDGVEPPFYLIESTAPNDVDDKSAKSIRDDELEKVGLHPIPSQDAIKEIALRLTPDMNDTPEEHASLVVMVHGFNSPPRSVLDTFASAANVVINDTDGIRLRSKKLVGIGYHWPSEGMFSLLLSSFRALPVALLAIFVVGVLLFLWPDQKVRGIAMFLTTITVVGIVLRSIVYFRDIYRATYYGVPDLVEVIRLIDREILNELERNKPEQTPVRVALSFIGHSMGALVVTNAVRILSDVFDPASIVRDIRGKKIKTCKAGEVEAPKVGEPEMLEKVTADIGHVFSLMRLVLVSPDIPAEALIGNRANFLKSSLRRFKEAYLFSNEGDEVLRMISTAANYFSFPTRSRDYGYRLGNVEILAENFGVIDVPKAAIEDKLRVGRNSVEQLDDKLSPVNPDLDGGNPAYAFSYFDCTDYVDCADCEGKPGQGKGLLTRALKLKAKDANASLGYLEHVLLLVRYLLPIESVHINVHGGYFDGETTRALIYRLACVGYHETEAILQATGGLSQLCSDRQIRVVLSDQTVMAKPKVRSLVRLSEPSHRALQ
jgi:hypothetical protein